MTKEQAVGQAITYSLESGIAKVVFYQDDYQVVDAHDRRYEAQGYDVLGVYDASIDQNGALIICNRSV